MDDFSWGSTRIVIGEKGKKVLMTDEGEFDEKSIPLKSWQEYEQELWAANDDNRSIGSWEGPVQNSRAPSIAPSNYGQESVLGITPTYPYNASGSVLGAPASILSPPSRFGVPSGRQSGLQSPIESPRQSQFMPSRQEVQAVVEDIISTSDLTTLTKKGVRQELEARYGADFGMTKTDVNQLIDEVLAQV